jgi:hypothetical protein
MQFYSGAAGQAGRFSEGFCLWRVHHLRPTVILRKGTNGFRCEWRAETYTAFHSVVSTAKANGASVLETVRFVLSARRPEEILALVE